ncbi:MAG: phosphatidylcholine/phosphatidylserine synthase [Gammaproteobacteria bacterium]|nr:phosphatidylcholine/phosphatidylserine synthase [Gammaproteobacteria bacterium]
MNPPVRKGIYLLPNLLTSCSLFGGIFAIINAIEGHFQLAAFAVFVAMVADGLDGRVARLTHTESEFGAQYDSLSDMVAFGAAPGLVLYLWQLNTLGNLGWVVTFVYIAATALRLARFHTQMQMVSKRHFQGLACPAAAAVVMSWIWLMARAGVEGVAVLWSTAALTLVVALLMVSHIRFASFKEVDFKHRIRLASALVMAVAVAVIMSNPPLLLFALSLTYAASGPVVTLWQLQSRRRKRQTELPETAAEPESDQTDEPDPTL